MSERIGVSSLKGVNVLYENDIYDLACLLLKLNDAQDKGTNRRYRSTVYGVVMKYSLLVHIEPEQIMAAIVKYRLPMGATVEHDKDV